MLLIRCRSTFRHGGRQVLASGRHQLIKQSRAHMQEGTRGSAACEGPALDSTHEHFMRLALEQARVAHEKREVPIGCVIVKDGQVIGRGSNRTNETRNGTAHAEYGAIQEVLSKFGSPGAAEFHQCTLYVTCEPCIMCAGALSLIGIGKVYFGCHNDKFGGCGSILTVHNDGCGDCGNQGATAGAPSGGGFPAQGGLLAHEAIKLLQEFYIMGNPGAPKPHRPLICR